MLAALIATLAPVESPVPLGPLEGLTSSAPAEAQPSAVGPGRPDPCNAPWQEDPDDASLCVLGQRACPEHPLQPGSYLVLSTEFPDFCEATVLQSVDPAAYIRCRVLTGYVIKTSVPGECRMIRPTQCAPNMHRTGTNTCRRAQRRTWSCPTGTPTNRFNTCYQQPPDYTTTRHPACVAGAPSFAISSCEDYVSQDFERSPALLPCGNFDTGDTRSALQDVTPSNLYWCQFESQYLDVDCYGAGATCTAADAACLKRASTTGGCNAIANALRCRKLQADYRDGSRAAEDVYSQGCTPCVVLPFSPTPPEPECPRDLQANPTLSTEGRLENTHQRRSDVGPSITSRSLCTDPPRGRLVWESSHQVGLAIVNSPVILRVVDVPVTSRTYRYIGVTGVATNDVRFWPTERRHFEYPGSAPTDPIVRTWPTFDDTLTFTSVDRIVGATRYRPGSSGFWNSGPCLIRILPDFRVTVTELWPDNDAAEIAALFGADALDWWTDLNPMGHDPTLQIERTEARGLNYVGTMNATELATELASRADSLTQEVRCNYGADVWCNWRPTRPGYYRLMAAGAWYMTKLGSNRNWQQQSWRGPVNAKLTEMHSNDDADTDCPPRHPSVRYHTDYDCLRNDLAWMNATPAEAGLQPDLSALLPAGSNAEWLYTDTAGPNVRCPPRDLRVRCGGSGESQNYTETEPIGILVHEVRVSTVTPDR